MDSRVISSESEIDNYITSGLCHLNKTNSVYTVYVCNIFEMLDTYNYNHNREQITPQEKVSTLMEVTHRQDIVKNT